MPLINWDQKYSVNVSTIDQEHKKLIDLTNELHEAMRSGMGKLIIGSTLEELLKYTQTHFINEEQLMSKTNYPGLAGHKLVHTKLVNQVHELISKNQSQSLSLSMEVMSFLKSWLIDHIQGVDKTYSSHLNKNGIY